MNLVCVKMKVPTRWDKQKQKSKQHDMEVQKASLCWRRMLRVLMMLGPGPTGVFVKHIYPVCIPAPIAYIQLSETYQLDVQHAHLNHCYVEALLTQGKVSW